MSQDPKTMYLSAEGVILFENRLAAERKIHAQICHDREIAHELAGDGWHDNPDFNRLQQLEASSTWKIHELETVLATARRFEVVEGARPTDGIQLGSVVKIEVFNMNEDEGQERVIEIVGYQESDPSKGCVSYDAPLAKAIMGLKAGDYQEAKLGNRAVDIEIRELYKSRSAAGLQSK